jgi:Mg2+-importing ATPase
MMLSIYAIFLYNLSASVYIMKLVDAKKSEEALSLNNLLYDFSQSTIPTDNVDQEYIEKPKRWDVSFIRKFMIFLGPISSIFDFLTFFVMLLVFNATEPLFQTAWFVESLLTQTFVIFVIRTRKTPFYKSRPSRLLLFSSLCIVGFASIVPFTPLGALFGFVELPLTFFIFLAVLICAYLMLVEIVKRWFYKRYAYRLEQILVPQKKADSAAVRLQGRLKRSFGTSTENL